jgi:hypothetical protein
VGFGVSYLLEINLGAEMAAIARSVRPVVRLLSHKQAWTSVYARGYAEMPFTFAAGNQVRIATVEFVRNM